MKSVHCIVDDWLRCVEAGYGTDSTVQYTTVDARMVL
jgi:hypothetical protein